MAKTLLFEIETPLEFSMRCTREYWQFIVSNKHPAMASHEDAIKLTLADPDEVRRSRKDRRVFLFYRGKSPRWICAVAKRENGEGFLVTVYPSDAIKSESGCGKNQSDSRRGGPYSHRLDR